MKTWIVTFEVVGFVLAYFLTTENERLAEIKIVRPVPHQPQGEEGIIQPWYGLFTTVLDHIRPPPLRLGEDFFYTA